MLSVKKKGTQEKRLKNHLFKWVMPENYMLFSSPRYAFFFSCSVVILSTPPLNIPFFCAPVQRFSNKSSSLHYAHSVFKFLVSSETWLISDYFLWVNFDFRFEGSNLLWRIWFRILNSNHNDNPRWLLGTKFIFFT